jgi:hypothetical protein
MTDISWWVNTKQSWETLLTEEQTNLQPSTILLRRMVRSPRASGNLLCSFRTCLVMVIKSVLMASAAWSMTAKANNLLSTALSPSSFSQLTTVPSLVRAAKPNSSTSSESQIPRTLTNSVKIKPLPRNDWEIATEQFGEKKRKNNK